MKTLDSIAKAHTDYVDVGGRRIATRSFGSGEPLVFLHRFRASMDDWDPALIEALARERRVITFDSAGVGESDGVVPATLEGAADVAADVIAALGLSRVDVLGWSMGGMTAQILAIKYPQLVRKLILTGTLPPGGSPEIVPSSNRWSQVAGKPTYVDDDIVYLFFAESEASRAAGRASLARTSRPGRPGSAVKTTPETMQAQLRAIVGFYKNEGNWYGRLGEIASETLVANGDRDGAFPPIDSVVLAREIPKSQLAIYPDSGHGFLFQYADRFATDALRFLKA